MTRSSLAVGHAIPDLGMRAETEKPRSESAVGALLPWADRLWAVTYTAHGPATGSGTGLYEITPDLDCTRRPESVVGTYANRLVHSPSDQAIVGPHLIDTAGNVRTFEDLLETSDGDPNRLAGTTPHPESDALVYVLTMEGLLYEANVHSLESTLVADLNEELAIEDGPGVTHFKGAHLADGRLLVANNTYDEPEYRGERASGRLAAFDGDRWEILEREPFLEVAGRGEFFPGARSAVFALGWDDASALLKVDPGTGTGWQTYRLPKGSRTYDHMWATEWTRIRAVEHDRFLVDCHGLFYELAPFTYGEEILELSPICRHLRVVPDFCSFGGMLVLGGNETTPSGDTNPLAGQPQSGLWVGTTDDLWEFGDPAGRGGPWRNTAVRAGDPSDPFLVRGFDSVLLHLWHGADDPVEIGIEIDVRGSGTWLHHESVAVPPDEHVAVPFADGFDAQWVRLRADADCVANAEFVLG